MEILALRALAFLPAPLFFLIHSMTRRREIPSIRVLLLTFLVLFSEILASGILPPPSHPSLLGNPKSFLGLLFVPAVGAGVSWVLLRTQRP